MTPAAVLLGRLLSGVGAFLFALALGGIVSRMLPRRRGRARPRLVLAVVPSMKTFFEGLTAFLARLEAKLFGGGADALCTPTATIADPAALDRFLAALGPPLAAPA